MPSASGITGLAYAAYEIYRSTPIATVRTAALVRQIWKLAWTGRAAFVFGLVKVAQPRPLSASPHFRRLAKLSAAKRPRAQRPTGARVAATRIDPKS